MFPLRLRLSRMSRPFLRLSPRYASDSRPTWVMKETLLRAPDRFPALACVQRDRVQVSQFSALRHCFWSIEHLLEGKSGGNPPLMAQLDPQRPGQTGLNA